MHYPKISDPHKLMKVRIIHLLPSGLFDVCVALPNSVSISIRTLTMTKCGNGCDEALGKCFSGRHVCRVVVVLQLLLVEEEEQEQKKEKEGEEEEENKEEEEEAFKKTLPATLFPLSLSFPVFQGSVHPFLAEFSSLCLWKAYSWPSLHRAGGFL